MKVIFMANKKKEIDFQKKFVSLIYEKLNKKKYKVESKKKLLYLNNIDSNKDNPIRGKGAFETDISISKITSESSIPIIILEVKDNITSHDIIVYNNKAERHKLIYPGLRYGILCYGLNKITNKFFTHNTDLDFIITINDFITPNLFINKKTQEKCQKILMDVINSEIKIYENYLNKINNLKKGFNFYQKNSNLFKLK